MAMPFVHGRIGHQPFQRRAHCPNAMFARGQLLHDDHICTSGADSTEVTMTTQCAIILAMVNLESNAPWGLGTSVLAPVWPNANAGLANFSGRVIAKSAGQQCEVTMACVVLVLRASPLATLSVFIITTKRVSL